MDELARAHTALPDDLLNFHHDPVACAVALGWSGAVIEEVRIEPVFRGEVLQFQAVGGGPTRLVVAVDGDAFTGTWLSAVAMTGSRGGPQCRPFAGSVVMGEAVACTTDQTVLAAGPPSGRPPRRVAMGGHPGRPCLPPSNRQQR